MIFMMKMLFSLVHSIGLNPKGFILPDFKWVQCTWDQLLAKVELQDALCCTVFWSVWVSFCWRAKLRCYGSSWLPVRNDSCKSPYL